jgi:hypothetical protein
MAIGRSCNDAERGVDIPIGIGCDIDGGPIDCADDHAGEGYDYGGYNSNRNYSAGECSVFSFLLIS